MGIRNLGIGVELIEMFTHAYRIALLFCKNKIHAVKVILHWSVLLREET